MKPHLLIVSVTIMLLASCSPAGNESVPDDDGIVFANIGTANARYVGDASCASCHADEYAGFQDHGMAQSFYEVTPKERPEDFSVQPIYHEQSDFYYQPVEADGKYYQVEFRLDERGRRIHSVRRSMDYVVGSGGAALTYLTSDNDHLYELPLTWYTQTGHWDFSPGYDVSNARFDRLILDRCMACHNNYPEDIPNLDGKYLSLPQGIGCERCHGPGSIHVDERLADPDFSGADTTIVNPSRISLEKRLDVCQQCHLNGSVNVLREGRTAFDFQPSELLSDHQAMFVVSDDDTSGISVISHADRMKQSECYLQTLNTPNPLECTTCHNPHQGFRNEGYQYFTATCMSCHEPQELVTGKSIEFKETHSVDANCISCHMPKQQTVDVPHASFTDHDIRVVGAGDSGARGIPEAMTSRDARMISMFARDDNSDEGAVYRGIALVTHGRQKGDTEVIRDGISLLQNRVSDLYPTGYFILGIGYLYLDEVGNAIPPLENAVRLDPNDPEKLNSLAQAYEADGRARNVIERLYTRALQIQPRDTDVRLNYGRYLLALNQTELAIDQFMEAVNERPYFADAYYNLGTAYLQAGDVDAGKEYLSSSLALDPDNLEAIGNLGFAHATTGQVDSARFYFERAVETDNQSALALANLGAFYLNEGDQSAAIDILLKAVTIRPDYVDALANLSLAYFQTDEMAKSREYAEQALRADPQNPLARQILDAL